jgi:hypothetical protein
VAKRWWYRWVRCPSLIGYTTSATSKGNGGGGEGRGRKRAVWPFGDGFKVRHLFEHMRKGTGAFASIGTWA